MKATINHIDKEISGGLTDQQILSLQKQYGRNIFEAEKTRRLAHILTDIIREPMFIMLSIACAAYFILGEYQEGSMMFIAMIIVTAISLYQEVKSTRALADLKKFTEPKITVIRNGKEEIILSEELVPGDVIVLEEGNRVPADALIIQQNDLTVNESIITGESMPVDKNMTEGNNHLFQGTIINSGKCYAQVTATGGNTTLGKLGKSISIIPTSKTLLQNQIGRFVKFMAVFGLVAFLIIWVINYINTENLVQSLLFGLTLAMSAVPEEIPVAFSSFMALGAYYMAKNGIITRQPQTIENLGSVSVICLDKTGTITENKMMVKSIFDYKTGLLEDLQNTTKLKNGSVLRYARLASEINPFDAMEKAIVEAYEQHIDATDEKPLKMIHEYPLGGRPPMMTHVYEQDNTHIIAAKGAPERILRICKVDDPTVSKIKNMIVQMASGGYRVIAVSSAVHEGEYPTEQDYFDWTFEGLLALYDPPRKNVQNIFKRWNKAGINIKLITGDYAETAINIAQQVGMQNHEKFITGDVVMQLNSSELEKTVKEINIYARMYPDAKLKVIDAIKANGDIVAMTGDGVNDGPALKSSHIGIAMGSKGTEIAKEAADLILTDDDLEKITVAIQQGRKIYSNLKKAVRYIISIHIPIILAASLPLILGWRFPNIFTPIHVIFLELIMGPTCSIFYEKEPVEEAVMKKPPRKRTSNMFLGEELLISIVQGIIISLGILILYYFFMKGNYSIEYIRTVVFTTLIFSNIFLTFINRSFTETFVKTIQYKNALTPLVLIVSAIFLSSIYFIAPVQQLFQLTNINATHYITCVLTALLCTGWFEIFKMDLWGKT
ncbi:MAG TPA: cation-translocating P-type ATPase [Chitinophagaceae bacterium]|nr:cation-translocating P-type ATPase [Chitinophagaceae bacterium]